jgi:hypothetical protein
MSVLGDELVELKPDLAWLKQYQLPISPGQALVYLRQLKESATLLLLYRYFFPAEFGSSQASTTPPPGQLYSPKELEFFKLVDQKLFPLPLDYYTEAEASAGDERSLQLDVMCLGLDWWDSEPQELHYGWHLLLVLCGSCEASILAAHNIDPELTELVESIQSARTGSGSYTNQQLHWLEEQCQVKGEPLASLPLALQLIVHDTGNLWLDPLPENPVGDAYWCIEDVELLTEAYREASQILERVEKLLDWLEVDLNHFKEVVQLWNQSCSTG